MWIAGPLVVDWWCGELHEELHVWEGVKLLPCPGKPVVFFGILGIE